MVAAGQRETAEGTCSRDAPFGAVAAGPVVHELLDDDASQVHNSVSGTAVARDRARPKLPP